MSATRTGSDSESLPHLAASKPAGSASNEVDEFWTANRLALLREAAQRRRCQPGFHDIHGFSNSRTLRASDLRLERFMSSEEWAGAHRIAGAGMPRPEQPEIVLLTGATDLLGRFLLLETLQRMAAQGCGRVFALVQARDNLDAVRRLRSSFDSGDPELLHLFDSLSERHLSVLAGDTAKPRLGLVKGVYMALAASVDTIIHNEALTDYALPYRKLFRPNVLGTVNVIRLALTLRAKAVAFISSVGVIAGVPHPDPVLETEDGPSLCTEHPGGGGDQGYAVGFGCSKWAGEVLLRQMHDDFNIPASIFRCGMLLPHSRFSGQLNRTDFFPRFLFGIANTGLAPDSFYGLPHGPNEHFDGTPVDVAAAGIVGLTINERSGFDTYHVVNDHWHDGISLDRVVDWISTAGIQVTRITKYEQWYQDFRQALSRLDTTQQESSPLPIIEHWRHPLPSSRVTKFDAANLQCGLMKYTQLAEVPHLSEAYIHQVLRYMMALGLISPDTLKVRTAEE